MPDETLIPMSVGETDEATHLIRLAMNDQAIFHKARRFYEHQGFKRVGRIEDYLSDASEMVVYMRYVDQ